MEKVEVKKLGLINTVDALTDILEILENAHYLQQLVEVNFFFSVVVM